MKKILTPLTSIIASVILFAGVPLIYAWTGPVGTPPSGNVAAPINVGASSQNKTGVLGLGGLAVFGKTLLTEATGYTLPTAKPSMLLGVNGAIGAAEYCDQNGMNCVTTLGGSSGTSVSSGGQPIVCGGWDTKYGSSGTFNEWGCGASATCPAGYDTIKSSKVTINLAEQTNLCVLHSAGGGSSKPSRASLIRARGVSLPIPSGLSDWPDTIMCTFAPGNQYIFDLYGTANGLVSYWTQDQIGTYFNFDGTFNTSQPLRGDPKCGSTARNISQFCAEGRCIQ